MLVFLLFFNYLLFLKYVLGLPWLHALFKYTDVERNEVFGSCYSFMGDFRTEWLIHDFLEPIRLRNYWLLLFLAVLLSCFYTWFSNCNGLIYIFRYCLSGSSDSMIRWVSFSPSLTLFLSIMCEDVFDTCFHICLAFL